jgi:hypothetical protein
MMHVALGWPYRDRKVRQGAVVYCALEGCSAFKNRIEAFRLSRIQENAGGVQFHLMAEPLSLVVDHAALIAAIREQSPNPAAVVIDTLNRSLAGSESSDEDMAAYIKAADAIRDAFNCAVVIVHHCGHEGTRPRGHSSLIGALDAQIAVTRDAVDKIIATVELMKDGSQGESFASRLEIVDLGTDADGDAITSCVVEAVEGFATRKIPPRKLTKTAKIVLAALHDAIGECGEVPPACSHIPQGVKCVTINQWRAYVYQRLVGDLDEPRAKQKAFNRGTETLTADNVAAVWNNYAWPCRRNEKK